MKLPSAKRVDIHKLTLLSVILNALQLICAIGIMLYVLFSKSFNLPEYAETTIVCIAAAVVAWGAVIDIRDARITDRVEEQRRMLVDAYGQLEDLNRALREQRHDFKNHLQVVYSLMEMESYKDARDYIQRVFDDVHELGARIKTPVPAVNALLSAKKNACMEKDIDLQTEVCSTLADIPLPGWELCRILGNLIDNATEALAQDESAGKAIRVRFAEDIRAWTVDVENNGPQIPEAHQRSVFLPGFTTKSSGHGNGLAIVRSLLEKYGGDIALTSDAQRTLFRLTIPRPLPAEDAIHANTEE